MDMQPIDPTRSLIARLTAEQWNTVLGAINELPHRIARPIFDELLGQLRQQDSIVSPDRADALNADPPETEEAHR